MTIYKLLSCESQGNDAVAIKRAFVKLFQNIGFQFIRKVHTLVV